MERLRTVGLVDITSRPVANIYKPVGKAGVQGEGAAVVQGGPTHHAPAGSDTGAASANAAHARIDEPTFMCVRVEM